MTTNHPTTGHTTTMVGGAALGAGCGLDWAPTVVNPALSIIGLLPTPQQRTAAFLALLCAKVERLGKGHSVISRGLGEPDSGHRDRQRPRQTA